MDNPKNKGRGGAARERGIAPVRQSQRTVAPTEADYAGSLDDGSAEKEQITVISFFAGGVEYAFPVAEAVEVVRPRPMTEVPHTPAFIKGIFSLRGEMVPVVDLKERLGAAPSQPRPYGARILITSIDDMKTGFLVDRLSGIKDVFLSDVTGPVTGQMPHGEAGFVKGVIKSGEKKILLLDSARLVDLKADG